MTNSLFRCFPGSILMVCSALSACDAAPRLDSTASHSMPVAVETAFRANQWSDIASNRNFLAALLRVSESGDQAIGSATERLAEDRQRVEQTTTILLADANHLKESCNASAAMIEAAGLVSEAGNALQQALDTLHQPVGSRLEVAKTAATDRDQRLRNLGEETARELAHQGISLDQLGIDIEITAGTVSQLAEVTDELPRACEVFQTLIPQQ